MIFIKPNIWATGFNECQNIFNTRVCIYFNIHGRPQVGSRRGVGGGGVIWKLKN